MPKYSFIVPVFQCAQYLERCVNSILLQDYTDFELLLVDDGSSDGSGELCDALSKADRRIRVFHKTNGGAASARNYGLDYAVGQYVLFIDGDDTISRDCLLRIDQATPESALPIFGIAVDHYRRDYLVSSQRISCRFSGKRSLPELTESFWEYYIDNQFSSACNKVFDRALLERNRIRFNEAMSIYEDFDFVLQVLQSVDSVFCMDQCLYHYRILVDKPHNRKLKDADKLRSDLGSLNRSFLVLFAKYPNRAVLDVGANLYMMVLQQHLMHTDHCRASVLANTLPAYCAESSFQKLLDRGGQLTEEAQSLLTSVQAGAYRRIAAMYRRKRRIRNGKQLVKRFLR